MHETQVTVFPLSFYIFFYSGTLKKEVPRNWQNLFAITRFRYIEVIFHIFYYYWSKENRSLYRDRSRTSLYRGSLCNIKGWEGVPIPHSRSLSRESRIPNFRHHYPEYRSLSQSRIRAQILANPAFPVAVKYRIPLTFPESRTLLWPNPGSREHVTFSFLLMITWQAPHALCFSSCSVTLWPNFVHRCG